MFHIATEAEIKAGRVTDVYFLRALEILRARGIHKRVVAEVAAKALPQEWEWAVLAGIEECLELLKGRPVECRGLKEGTVFHAGDPVLEIEGFYEDFAVLETAVLGFLCQASGVATAAAQCKKAAGEKPVMSFGARRMHPAIAPMVERSAYIGGCDGVAVVKSAEVIGIEPVGTMPHAVILLVGDTVEATKAFNEVISVRVPRISLIDTFHDEKFAALEVAEALGDDLYAVRLDTPASRRGNFLKLIEEIRWELDIRGFEDVKIYVSGNIDVKAIRELNGVVDAYGIGTSISDAPIVDFSMDIVHVDGKPIAKRGKKSGVKVVYRCPQCFKTQVLPRNDSAKDCDCGKTMEALTMSLIVGGVAANDFPRPQEIRTYVLAQLLAGSS